MECRLEDAVAVLERTPGALDALLRELPEIWVKGNEGEGTWNAIDVIGHLIDADRVNWMPRARQILKSDEMTKFAPFDRGGHVRETQGKELAQLLDAFAALRAKNVAELRGMEIVERDYERKAEHPALGVVTLGQLLSAWVAHDLTHLHQISRIMAYQYHETVGPWNRFLGVLQCKGHSAAA
jgi:DinB superfamily